MTRRDLEGEVLRCLQHAGQTRPSALVDKVTTDTKASKRDVREALRVLVDRRLVGLTWDGKLQADV